MKTTRAATFLTLAFLEIGLSTTPAWAGLFDLETKLTASDGEGNKEFGWSVSISGNTAIVGTGTASGEVGQAYLYDVSTGNEIVKLTASDVIEEINLFGISVAIDGNTAIVGASADDDGGNASGAAYLFDVSTGNELAKLTASDAATAENFGRSVAISGNTAIIGAGSNVVVGPRLGSAYLFDVTTGNQLRKLTASDTAVGDRFGYALSISGNTAIVGAPWNDDAVSQARLICTTSPRGVRLPS